MPSLYDKADIYDLLEDERHCAAYKKHWESVFGGKKIKTLLDVSIGSGSVTLPLCEMGVTVSGSDLSEDMLKKCKAKAEKKEQSIELNCSDFRDLSCWSGRQFDCVASTGNSLPHVKNEDVLSALEQMDKLVAPEGYIYIDTRNWEKIIREHQRFYLYNPVFNGDTRINLVQVWDFNADETITFNLHYTFEKNNKVFNSEKFDELYFPIKKSVIENKLKSMGYGNFEIKSFPSLSETPKFEDNPWYYILAKKSK